jgi:hypothetical protein
VAAFFGDLHLFAVRILLGFDLFDNNNNKKEKKRKENIKK